jgi:hypothetical protein
MLASGPLKILAVYLSPSRPIVGSDLSACFGGGFPVVMAGELKAKHVDWNSRPTTTRCKLLRDYASGNSCLIYGPDSPTTLPYNSSNYPRCLRHRNYQGRNLPSVSHGVLRTKLRSPSCTDRHDVPIILSQTASPTCLQADRLGQISSQPRREATVHPLAAERGGNRYCVEEMSSEILEALAASIPESRPRDDPRPQYRRAFRMKYT